MSVPVFGIAGYKDVGKTTLTAELVRELTNRGFTVSTIKHAHHGFDIDQPGRDSFRHREAGAQEVAVVSGTRWVMMRELRGEAEPELDEILQRFSPCDLVLTEGYKHKPHPKLEVRRPDLDRLTLPDDDPTIVAIASSTPVDNARVPVIDLNDVPRIADFVIEHLGLKIKV